MSAGHLNAASRLAMIAERVAKLHAQIGREVLVVRSRRALAEAGVMFERDLREATAGAGATADLRDNYRLLRLLWDEYRPAAMQAPTPEGHRKLAGRAEEVAWVAQKGARLLQEHAPSRAGELVHSAGVARAAAQRLGKLHLQRGWSAAAGAHAPELKRAEGEILLAIAQLKSARETGDEAGAALAMAEDQLMFLRQAVARLEAGRERATQLEHIAKSADHAAEAMDRAAKLYEAVSSRAGPGS